MYAISLIIILDREMAQSLLRKIGRIGVIKIGRYSENYLKH